MQIRPAPHGANVGGLALHSHRWVVLLQVSAFTRQLVAFKHEHGGCPSSSVVFTHCLPSSQGANEGTLKLHSHVEGTVVPLQVSAFSKQCSSSKQEQGGCPGSSVVFKHIRPASQIEKFGELKLHSQIAGIAVALQVSEFSKQCSSIRQEQGGCPEYIDILRQDLPVSQASNDGTLPLHTQLVGFIVVLHVSELS